MDILQFERHTEHSYLNKIHYTGIRGAVQELIPGMDSPGNVHRLFREVG